VGVWEPTFVAFGSLLFEFLTPFILKGHNFLNSIPFLMIFSAPNVPIGGVQILFRHKNNGALTLDLTYHEHLSVIVAIQL
jgi:hypothetical protein